VAAEQDDLRAQRWARLDSCAVADALDRLGLIGVLGGVRALTGPVRVCGRVVTVLLGPPVEGGPSRHLCTAAVEAAREGEVLVVAHQARTDCAGWGGNLSRAARRRGLAGTIVHGAVRDVDESRALGYPVFGTATTPLTARGRAQEHAWGVAVDLGGVTVESGDWVVADGTGVVFVAASRAEQVLADAEEIAAREAAMAAALEAGAPISEVMGASYETMLRSGPAAPDTAS
jgi:4-hydroxy-4-methyl-2-oxoglutarate aldolase